MEIVSHLPSADKLKIDMPLAREVAMAKARHDAELARILRGQSDKFLLVIGPCSADNPIAVVEYAQSLAKIARTAQNVHIVMRVFTAKPRTATMGYMGLIHEHGVEAARRLHLDVLAASGGGLTIADEMLYPALYPYFSDVVSYFVVGARSSENQEHRLVASGLNAAVAIKNPLSGNVAAMVNAVFAAQQPQEFIFGGNVVRSRGNPLAHSVLRGCNVNDDGSGIPNYHAETLHEIAKKIDNIGVVFPALIIDTNHGNSGKNHSKQPAIALEVMQKRRENSTIRKLVNGLMIESYIKEGNAATFGAEYGRSVTDACLSLAATEELILTINEILGGLQ